MSFRAQPSDPWTPSFVVLIAPYFVFSFLLYLLNAEDGIFSKLL